MDNQNYAIKNRDQNCSLVKIKKKYWAVGQRFVLQHFSKCVYFKLKNILQKGVCGINHFLLAPNI